MSAYQVLQAIAMMIVPLVVTVLQLRLQAPVCKLDVNEEEWSLLVW